MFVGSSRDGTGECLDTGGGGVQTLEVPRSKVRPSLQLHVLSGVQVHCTLLATSEGNSLAGSLMKVLGADTGDQVTCAAHTALPPQGQYCDQAQGQGSDTGIVHGHHAHAHTLMLI